MPGTADLLLLVYDRPVAARAAATAVLADSPSPYDASIAHHVLGLVERDFGDLTAGIAQLRRALALARRSGSAERRTDVRAALGTALVHAGRVRAGLAMLDEAVAGSPDHARARYQYRRGAVHWLVGRHADGLADAAVVVPALRKAGDTVWAARALQLRALTQLALGRPGRADADCRTAEELLAGVGQDFELAVARHNRALVAFRLGDLPGALTLLDEVSTHYRALDAPMAELTIDRCAVLVAAGLAEEALGEADRAAVDLERTRGQATRRAELLLVAAKAALAAGDPAAAHERSAGAARLFGAQRRVWWQAHARLVVAQSRFAVGEPPGRLLHAATDVAAQLAALGSPEVAAARLHAGRVALAAGRPADAGAHLAAAAAGRSRGSAIDRTVGWLAVALAADAGGDRRRLLVACRRGLDVLDAHRLTFGGTELRARATAHGSELAELALRTCVTSGRTRQALAWADRWRATACTVAPVRPIDDAAMRDDLAALREVSMRLEHATRDGLPTALLAAECRRLEHRVRDRDRRSSGGPARRGNTLDVAALLDTLAAADTRLIEIVELDGTLLTLVCGGGRVRRGSAGPVGAARESIEQAQWLLRAAARDPSPRRMAGLVSGLDEVGRRLEELVLGGAVRALADGPVVIVPTGRLHGLPWALLPSLSARPHGTAPSAVAWMTARAVEAPPERVVLVQGPDLPGAAAEMQALGRLYGDTPVRQGAAAAVGPVLAALDGASLAHVAAHGRFSARNPLLSALHLSDGPLTGYDLEQLHRTPHRLVLSSCDAGQAQPLGADEVLGLATALLPRGTAGIVASPLPVNDAAAARVMVTFHAALRHGAGLAAALAKARSAADDDPLVRLTAMSFVASGAS